MRFSQFIVPVLIHIAIIAYRYIIRGWCAEVLASYEEGYGFGCVAEPIVIVWQGLEELGERTGDYQEKHFIFLVIMSILL